MVPNGWNKQTVGDLCDFINGNGFKSSEWSDKGLPIIRIQNLNGSNNFNYYDGKVLEKWIVNQGDILFAWAGSKGVSFGAKYWNGPKGLLNQHIFRVEPKAHIDKKWLFWVLLKVTQRVENMAHGFKATLLHVQKADITEQVILVPSLSEQQKIAHILSTWDQAISATEKLLENSQQQKKALMQQLLTGKKRLLDEIGLRFNIPWEKYRLETFLKEEKQRNKDNSLSRVLSVTNHSGFVLPENQFSKRIASDEVSNYKVVIKGQFGYNPSRINVGSFARLDQFDNGLLSPMYVVFSITSEKLDSDFFLYWMKSNEAKQRINNSTQGSVRDSVGFDAISSFALKLPKIQEQRKIAKVLSLADQEIETLQKKLDYLKQEKKALMQQLLTGKRRVKV